MDTKDALLFVRVAETLSFKDAAAQLGISRSAASKRIALLETRWARAAGGDPRMSQILRRLTYFKRERTQFAGGHGVLTTDDRRWEDAYRLSGRFHANRSFRFGCSDSKPATMSRSSSVIACCRPWW